MSDVSQVPPYSEESERACLGCILFDAAPCMERAELYGLGESDFYVPAHRTIFAACAALYELGFGVDAVSVGQELESQGRLDACGGRAQIDALIDSMPAQAHFEYYLRVLLDASKRRAAIAACTRLASQLSAVAATDAENTDKLIAEHDSAILAIAESGKRLDDIPWSQTVRDTMAVVEKIRETGRASVGIQTGFANIDRVLLGLKDKCLYILAARPSMGKTSLAMNMVENIALRQGEQARRVGVFSLEMDRESLCWRMLCCRAGVDSKRVSQGYISVDGQRSMTMAARELEEAGLFLDDSSGLDVKDLRVRARRMVKRNGVGLLVIDYLQLLHCREAARHGKQIETAAISSTLKELAKELGIPVMVLCQLNRGLENRDKSGRPRLSDLRDSGAIEQDADVVMLLHRPCKIATNDESDDERLAIVEIAKNRCGPTAEVRLNFEAVLTQFRDRAMDVDAGEG